MKFNLKNNDNYRSVDITAWSDETKAYCKPLAVWEQLDVSEQFKKYIAEDSTSEDKFKALFKIALICLVGEDRQPLLAAEDEQTLANASIVPFHNLLPYAINPEYVDDLKKR